MKEIRTVEDVRNEIARIRRVISTASAEDKATATQLLAVAVSAFDRHDDVTACQALNLLSLMASLLEAERAELN